MPRCSLIALLALTGLGACVDRGAGPQGKKIDPGVVRANLLNAPPTDIQRVDVSIGGKVIYLGNKLVSTDGRPLGAVAPGATARLVHYWQVVQPIGSGWKLFRFARGAAGSADFQSFQATDMELGLPVEKWKAGQIIQDQQDIVLRPDWRSPTATVHVGLVADGGHQVGDRMMTTPSTGPAVADRAVIARTLEVDLSKAPPPPGTLHVPHVAGPITVDGLANEPGWSSGVMSADFVTADGSPEPVGKAIARMAWDETFLYVFVQVTDTDIYSQYKTHDEPIWKQDVVELFIDADGNRRGYVELQVNPNNTTFDSFFATTRAQPGDETWTSDMRTAVRVRGTADKAGDTDQGWDVEIAIPLVAVKGKDAAMNVRLPPQVGDKWRLNVVRVDYRSNGGSPGVASWNRIGYGDFHALDRMLTVIFADAQGSITARPQPPMTPPEGAGSAAAGSAAGSAASAGSAAPMTTVGPTPAPRAGSAAPTTTVGPTPAHRAGSAATAPVAPKVPAAGSASGSAAGASGSAAGSGVR